MDHYSNGIGNSDIADKPKSRMPRETSNETVNPAQQRSGDDKLRQRLIAAGYAELAEKIK